MQHLLVLPPREHLRHAHVPVELGKVPEALQQPRRLLGVRLVVAHQRGPVLSGQEALGKVFAGRRAESVVHHKLGERTCGAVREQSLALSRAQFGLEACSVLLAQGPVLRRGSMEEQPRDARVDNLGDPLVRVGSLLEAVTEELVQKAADGEHKGVDGEDPESNRNAEGVPLCNSSAIELAEVVHDCRDNAKERLRAAPELHVVRRHVCERPQLPVEDHGSENQQKRKAYLQQSLIREEIEADDQTQLASHDP
mmetsp:Transcript_33917/g.77506  ORF Transcript_33917/g.77506 Transcript_33917/m.77506 type:complete len:253 (-) Transcript_33917:1897-2655(-)